MDIQAIKKAKIRFDELEEYLNSVDTDLDQPEINKAKEDLSEIEEELIDLLFDTLPFEYSFVSLENGIIRRTLFITFIDVVEILNKDYNTFFKAWALENNIVISNIEHIQNEIGLQIETTFLN